jgi:hypothetical protein
MDAFHQIHRENTWNNPETVSGSGSTAQQTERIRAELPAILAAFQITSILDAPCGDYNWMRLTDLGDRTYVGVDIIPDIIDEATRIHGTAQRQFLCLDLSRAPLPAADLILSRDCLVHFSYADVFATLENFRRTGARFLLTTTYPAHTFNVDCPTGHWRPLNLELPPFNFPPPLRVLTEECGEGPSFADKSLGLWSMDDTRVP